MQRDPQNIDLQRNLYAVLTQFFENIEATFEKNEPIVIYPEHLEPIQKALEQIKAQYLH